jgi:hypothetical protein
MVEVDLAQVHISEIPIVSICPLLETISHNEFTFIVNEQMFQMSVVKAVILSPAVQQQLSIDSCARKFVIRDSEIDSTVFSSLQNFMFGFQVILHQWQQKSLLLLSQILGNTKLERLFLGLWNDYGNDINITIWDAIASLSHLDLRIWDFSLFSTDTLDNILSNEPFIIDSEDALLQNLLELRNQSLLRHIQFRSLSSAIFADVLKVIALYEPTESLQLAMTNRRAYSPSSSIPVSRLASVSASVPIPIPPPIQPLRLAEDSLIVDRLSRLFPKLGATRFALLWRGSRDGFGAKDFHNRCDGHTNTLTFVKDTNGNIFGGFTPVAWASSGGYNSDHSLASFIFTLKNPYNVRMRTFALKEDRRHNAIGRNAEDGPKFGVNCIRISSHCNVNNDSFTGDFGRTYETTEWDPRDDHGWSIFLTGSAYFRVQEIEVFKIVD